MQQLCKRFLFYKIKTKGQRYWLDNITEKWTTKNKQKKKALHDLQKSKEILVTAEIVYPAHTYSLWEVRGQSPRDLLLGVGDIHGASGRDPEALQRILGHARLRVALKLHKGDVMFTRDQPDLFVTRKPDSETHA